jgi:hypothetical protein
MKLQFHLPSLIEFVKYDDDDNAVDSRILRAQRPILKVKPIFPHELDSVVTMTLTGRYQRASILTIIMVDERGKSIQKDFLQAHMSRAEDDRYFEETGLHPIGYLPVTRASIYEFIKGTTAELISKFYDINKIPIDKRKYEGKYITDNGRRVSFTREFVGIDPELSDERFYKHFSLNKGSVEEFEKKISQTAEFIWRESLL